MAWGILRILLKKKDLANFELILLFITLGVVLPKLLLIMYNFLGLVVWKVFDI